MNVSAEITDRTVEGVEYRRLVFISDPLFGAFGLAAAPLNWRALCFCPRLLGRESGVRPIIGRSAVEECQLAKVND